MFNLIRTIIHVWLPAACIILLLPVMTLITIILMIPGIILVTIAIGSALYGFAFEYRMGGFWL